jgi:DNA-binding MarR family transcriptional regulator
LTPHGRRQFLRMAAVHEHWVIELFAGWSAEEKRRVHALLAALKRHLAGVDRSTQKRRRREKA